MKPLGSRSPRAKHWMCTSPFLDGGAIFDDINRRKRHSYFVPRRRPLAAGSWRAVGQTRSWEKQAGTIEFFKVVGVDLQRDQRVPRPMHLVA